MSIPPGAEVTPAAPKSRQAVPSHVRLVVVIVAVAVASPLITAGVFAVANYIENTTTVTITIVSWEIVLHGQSQYEYTVVCQSNMVGEGPFGPSPPPPAGPDACPYRAHPGSDYNASFYVSSFFQNSTLTLVTPAPFALVSTTPDLPTPVSAGGLELTVELRLPTTAGQYGFTGVESFS